MDNWYESVMTDLHNACHALKTAHAAEAEATMAVTLADIAHDNGTVYAFNTGKLLKECHAIAVREVNESEARVREEIEGERTHTYVYEEPMTTYAAKLKERSETLYECHTKTLVVRHLLDARAKKLQACKHHLVSMVQNRTTAELEVSRISKLYTDELVDKDKLLEQQLEFVRIGNVDATTDHNNAYLSFMNDFARQYTLFDTTPKNLNETKDVVHQAVCELVERVVDAANATNESTLYESD